MKIRILAVGRIKEKYMKEALADYEKRLGPYTPLEIREVKDLPLPKKMSEKDEEKVLEEEGRALLDLVESRDLVVSLEIGGKSLDSLALADYIRDKQIQGTGTMTFIIGGSLGLSKEVSKRADLKLSLSSMTLPHNLARLVLLEQVYRSFRIIAGHTYHK